MKHTCAESQHSCASGNMHRAGLKNEPMVKEKRKKRRDRPFNGESAMYLREYQRERVGGEVRVVELKVVEVACAVSECMLACSATPRVDAYGGLQWLAKAMARDGPRATSGERECKAFPKRTTARA